MRKTSFLQVDLDGYPVLSCARMQVFWFFLLLYTFWSLGRSNNLGHTKVPLIFFWKIYFVTFAYTLSSTFYTRIWLQVVGLHFGPHSQYSVLNFSLAVIVFYEVINIVDKVINYHFMWSTLKNNSSKLTLHL